MELLNDRIDVEEKEATSEEMAEAAAGNNETEAHESMTEDAVKETASQESEPQETGSETASPESITEEEEDEEDSSEESDTEEDEEDSSEESDTEEDEEDSSEESAAEKSFYGDPRPAGEDYIDEESPLDEEMPYEEQQAYRSQRAYDRDFERLLEDETDDVIFYDDRFIVKRDPYHARQSETQGRTGSREGRAEQRQNHGEASSQEGERKVTLPPGRQDGYPVRNLRPRSARPRQITYVDMSVHDEYVPPLIKKKKGHKGAKVMAGLLGIVVLLLAAGYAGLSYYYTDHFFIGTRINGIDSSNMTPYEVEQAIAKRFDDYSISVASRNQETQTIQGSAIDYCYLSDGEILKLLQRQKPYEWIRGFFDRTSYTVEENVSYNKKLLRTQLSSLACAQEENQVPPVNAYITRVNDEFAIVPETEGSDLNLKEAFYALDEAIEEGEASIDLDQAGAYEAAQLTGDSPEIIGMLNAYNNYANASITYTFGDDRVTLNGDQLTDWLEVDENGRIIQDPGIFMGHVYDFVGNLAAEHDTVGTTRPFYASDGRLVYVYSYVFGWQIDQVAEAEHLAADIAGGAVVTREPEYAMRGNSYGFNDLGDTYIEVDMGNQHMYYYQNGYIIFDSDFVSGDVTKEGRATPEGVYYLYGKQSPAVLRGEQDENGKYEYETEVEYWMPFNGGVGFHDAPWQPYFGGDRYMGGGSHGCINLPSYAAAELYNIIGYDVPIVCFY